MLSKEMSIASLLKRIPYLIAINIHYDKIKVLNELVGT